MHSSSREGYAARPPGERNRSFVAPDATSPASDVTTDPPVVVGDGSTTSANPAHHMLSVLRTLLALTVFAVGVIGALTGLAATGSPFEKDASDGVDEAIVTPASSTDAEAARKVS